MAHFRVSSALNPSNFNPLRAATRPPSKVDFPKPALGISRQCRNISSNSLTPETEAFLLNTINLTFFERLNLAWKIVFPSPSTRRKSNANIAKQRLKMILFSDRCAVSKEAKQKIVNNVVDVLSDFVEIESQDKVHLGVSRDPDLGTIYSVSVPVRRVRSEYQEEDEAGTIMNIENEDTGEMSGSVDAKFDFDISSEKYKDSSV